jgi:hypothetical protein
VHAYWQGLDTPLAEDVVWAVENVPPGASISAIDAGFLGGIPGVTLLDLRGLNHRPAALAEAQGSYVSWFEATMSSESRPTFFRVAFWDGKVQSLPQYLTENYQLATTLEYGGGVLQWWSRPDAPPAPSSEAVIARWAQITEQHPSHPLLLWHRALYLADQGRLAEAEQLRAKGAAQFPYDGRFSVSGLDFTAGSVPMAWEDGAWLLGGWLRSRPLSAGEDLVWMGSGEVRVMPENCAGSTLTVAGDLHWSGCAGRVRVERVSGELRVRVQ